jgi:hypothetical protein
MDNFVCSCCGVIDSIYATPQLGGDYKCCECQGQPWHGQFPKEQFTSVAVNGPMLNRSMQGHDADAYPGFS